MMNRTKPALALLLLLAWGCTPEDQRTDTLDVEQASQRRADLPPEVVEHLDRGSELFRVDSFEAALAEYRQAAELAPESAAAWFGVFMAEHALGHVEAAESAYARAQEVVPGASLIHPTAKDTSR